MAEVVANGVKLHVQKLRRQACREEAPGPLLRGRPVVAFIHGLVVDNMSSLYYSLANPVAQAGAEAILYDMRGHGRSARPLAGYTLDDGVADLIGLLDALEVDVPVHLVGHSYGGTVALRAGMVDPGRIASLVLIEPHCSESHDGGDWTEDIADLLTISALSFECNPLPPDLNSADQRRARAASAADFFLNSTTLIEDVASSPPFADDELASLAVPVMAVYGEYTDLPSSARKLAACVPGCRLEIIPDLGHSVLRDATGTVLRLLLGWLDGWDASGALEATG